LQEDAPEVVVALIEQFPLLCRSMRSAGTSLTSRRKLAAGFADRLVGSLFRLVTQRKTLRGTVRDEFQH